MITIIIIYLKPRYVNKLFIIFKINTISNNELFIWTVIRISLSEIPVQNFCFWSQLFEVS